MGFFSNLKSLRLSKKGYELAHQGDVNNAIKLFDEAWLGSSDFKTSAESKSLYHLCLTLQYVMSGNIENGKKEYQNFKSVQQSYVDACNLTLGFGTRTRYFVWEKNIKELITKYKGYFSQIIS